MKEGDAMVDEDERREMPPHVVGMVLDSLSIDELEARIAMLEAEIARLQQAISEKSESRNAAEAVFRL